MYFTSGMPTKIDSWGRYGSPYSPPRTWSPEPVSGRARDRFDDLYIARERNSTFDNIFSNKCHIINMFNLLNTFLDQENTVYLDKLYFIYYMQTGLQWIFIWCKQQTDDYYTFINVISFSYLYSIVMFCSF